MRIKVSNTWKTKVEASLPGEAADEIVQVHFTAEFKELSLTEMKDSEQKRRRQVRKLAELRANKGDPAEIWQVEEALANADRGLLDLVLVAVHGLELERADGSVMSAPELLDYVKDHIDFMVPIVQAFADRVGRVAEKNSARSGKRSPDPSPSSAAVATTKT